MSPGHSAKAKLVPKLPKKELRAKARELKIVTLGLQAFFPFPIALLHSQVALCMTGIKRDSRENSWSVGNLRHESKFLKCSAKFPTTSTIFIAPFHKN